jgi:osmotically-inducible protein OsmY
MKYLICLLISLSVLAVGCTQQKYDNVQSSQQTAKSNQLWTDTEITTKVKSKFISDDLFSSKDVAAMTIHVETINGVVHLTGTAKNATQAENAVKIAKSVEGVKHVVSKVVVKK